MTLTCDRCLDGRHARCTDKTDCACRCRRRLAPGKATAGQVLRAPAPAKPRPSTPLERIVSGHQRKGRPRVWPDDATRRRESARRVRGTYERVAVELASDPGGRRWSSWTRTIFAEQVARLEQVMTG